MIREAMRPAQASIHSQVVSASSAEFYSVTLRAIRYYYTLLNSNFLVGLKV